MNAEIRNPKSAIRNSTIVFDDVSKFYGEILGVNRVNLQIAPGITSLVGPNGAGFSARSHWEGIYSVISTRAWLRQEKS